MALAGIEHERVLYFVAIGDRLLRPIRDACDVGGVRARRRGLAQDVGGIDNPVAGGLGEAGHMAQGVVFACLVQFGHGVWPCTGLWPASLRTAAARPGKPRNNARH